MDVKIARKPHYLLFSFVPGTSNDDMIHARIAKALKTTIPVAVFDISAFSALNDEILVSIDLAAIQIRKAGKGMAVIVASESILEWFSKTEGLRRSLIFYSEEEFKETIRDIRQQIGEEENPVLGQPFGKRVIGELRAHAVFILIILYMALLGVVVLQSITTQQLQGKITVLAREVGSLRMQNDSLAADILRHELDLEIMKEFDDSTAR